MLNKKVEKFQLCFKTAASLFPFSCLTFPIDEKILFREILFGSNEAKANQDYLQFFTKILKRLKQTRLLIHNSLFINFIIIIVIIIIIIIIIIIMSVVTLG